MLSFKFSGAIFISILLLLITIPAISFNATVNDVEFARHFLDSSSAPKTPLNKQATQFVKKYLKDNDECLDAIKEKHASTFNMMDEVFNKFGLPVELKYLAVVESELNPKAVSRVGAAGPWQFMPATARELGLKITRKYDERKNFKKSTNAAALYLRDLHRQYGDWLLVLAAYNCGPVPVNAAIRKSGTRSFWKLQYFLPAETRGHVKKYIATHYYFEGDGSVTTLTKAEIVKYTKAIELWAAAQERKSDSLQILTADNISMSDTSGKKTMVPN